MLPNGEFGMFYFTEINGYKVLKSDMLNGIDAFFTTRNCPNPNGRECEVINGKDEKNSLRLSPYFEKPLKIVSPNQTHSDNIAVVDECIEYEATDGLIITEPDTAIFLRFADCTPLIFYDQIKNIAAISHAGWRGTVARIAVKTVAKMVLNFSSKPENIIVLIGPAISKCCYEVSDDVKEQLLSTVKDRTDLYNKTKVDLKNINARQLQEIGVENIDVCPYCTSCNNDLFYSYRKENGTNERHFAVVKI